MRISSSSIEWAKKLDNNLIRGMIGGGFSRETLKPIAKGYPPAGLPKKIVLDIPKITHPSAKKCEPSHPRSIHSFTHLPSCMPPRFFEQIFPQGVLN